MTKIRIKTTEGDIFGEVEEGLDVVKKILNAETLRDDRPKNDVSMTMELIEE